MECRRFDTASEFLEFAEPSLLNHETEHNLVLGLATNIAQGRMPATEASFFSVVDQGEPVGHAVTSQPSKPLALSRMPAEAVASLVRSIHNRGIHLGGVVGPIEASERFAALWETVNGAKSQLAMHQGLYQLDQVVRPEPDGGRLVPIEDVNDDVALDYILGFLRDAVPDEKQPDRVAKESLQRHRQNQSLFFWRAENSPQDGAPVSMAARARETRNGATIALVYTPPEWRGRGYASRLVAAVSEAQLKAGKKFCNLFTDLGNPTSNSIYQKIGYRKVGESKYFAFPL